MLLLVKLTAVSHIWVGEGVTLDTPFLSQEPVGDYVYQPFHKNICNMKIECCKKSW